MENQYLNALRKIKEKQPEIQNVLNHWEEKKLKKEEKPKEE